LHGAPCEALKGTRKKLKASEPARFCLDDTKHKAVREVAADARRSIPDCTGTSKQERKLFVHVRPPYQITKMGWGERVTLYHKKIGRL
jgi:hypothetical protein